MSKDQDANMYCHARRYGKYDDKYGKYDDK